MSNTPPSELDSIKGDHRADKSLPSKSNRRPFRKTFKKIRNLLGFSVLAVVGLFYSFSPSIDVSSSQLLDLSDPFATPFVVSNDSYLAIKKVSAQCALNDVQTRKNIDIKGFIVLGDDVDLAPEMLPGEKLTVKCRFREAIRNAGPVRSADIGIIIKYRYVPLLWPFDRQREFRFTTATASDGSSHWFSSTN